MTKMLKGIKESNQISLKEMLQETPTQLVETIQLEQGLLLEEVELEMIVH